MSSEQNPCGSYRTRVALTEPVWLLHNPCGSYTTREALTCCLVDLSFGGIEVRGGTGGLVSLSNTVIALRRNSILSAPLRAARLRLVIRLPCRPPPVEPCTLTEPSSLRSPPPFKPTSKQTERSCMVYFTWSGRIEFQS